MRRIALIVALLLALTARDTQAALAQSILTGACDTSNNTVFTTASITATSGALTLAAVLVTSETNASTVEGGGLTWTQVASATVNFDTTGTPTSRLQIFRGEGTPSAGALTITAGGVTIGACWKVFEITGQHATTPIVQVGTGRGDAQSTFDLDAPLSAFGDAANWTLWIVAFDEAAGTHTLEGSFAQIGGAGRVTMSSPSYSLSANYLNANDTTPSSTLDVGRDFGGIGMEIAPAAAGAGGTQSLTLLGVGCEQ